MKQESGTFGSIRALTYGNGMWVVVGYSGLVLTSRNGTSWTKQIIKSNSKRWNQYTSANTTHLMDVAYNNGLWVVVGSFGTILTSSDAISWKQQPTQGNISFQEIAYGNGMWAAVDDNGNIFTSSNGNYWKKINISASYMSIVYANDMWIIGDSAGRLFTSRNGTSWTINEEASKLLGSINDIAYGNGMWVAVGNIPYDHTPHQSNILTSKDGKTWQRQSGIKDFLYSVAYGDGMWVTVGSRLSIHKSKDGQTWQTEQRIEEVVDMRLPKDLRRDWSDLQNLRFANGLRGIYNFNSTWVIVGDKGAISTSSENSNIKSFINELYELEQQAMDSRNEQQVMDSRQKSILTKIQTSLKNDEVIKESIEKIPTEKMSFKKDDQLMIQVELEELKKRERVSEINFKTNIKNHKWLRGEKGMFNLIPEE